MMLRATASTFANRVLRSRGVTPPVRESAMAAQSPTAHTPDHPSGSNPSSTLTRPFWLVSGKFAIKRCAAVPAVQTRVCVGIDAPLVSSTILSSRSAQHQPLRRRRRPFARVFRHRSRIGHHRRPTQRLYRPSPRTESSKRYDQPRVCCIEASLPPCGKKVY